MHPGRHDLLARLEARDHHLVAVGGEHLHDAALNGAGTGIEQPDSRVFALASQGAGGQLHAFGRPTGLGHDSVHPHISCSAQWHRFTAFETELDQEGAGDTVCTTGHLSHPGWDELGGRTGNAGPQAHLGRHARPERRHTVFGNRNPGLPCANVGQAQHRRTRGQDLSHLGHHRGHQAVGIGHQTSVARLIALHRQLGTRLAQGCLGRVDCCPAAFDLGVADETLAPQVLEAAQLGRRQ
ncbi:hypothetical protein RZS08_06735, partial [Arthrospira platensis SPKY1]|nr:hypothetical protein [Arthrospira platensis SPKY1]